MNWRDLLVGAFVYLQQKMVQEAKSLLLRKVSTHGAEPIELANLALAMGLRIMHALYRRARMTDQARRKRS
ncbi:hypothetical protein ABIB70_002942 [Bradyrhizobium sp. F1.2.8]